MDLIKLGAVFAVLVIFIKLKKPLYISLIVATVLGLVLYQIPISEYGGMLYRGAFGSATITMIGAFYSITFLQRMLEKRERLLIAERSISAIFNSRRINATIVPFIVGLLPSAGAMHIASPIVKSASGDALDLEEQAFVTTYYRHISEAFVPTYSSIILALRLSGVSMSSFVIAMIPMVLVLFWLGYIFYVKRIPELETREGEVDKSAEWKNVFRSLWSIILTVVVILAVPLPIPVVVGAVIFINFFVDKFTIEEIKPMFVSAFESKLVFSTVLIMIFKELLTLSGVVQQLPQYFVNMPIPPQVIYTILFFFGTIVVGAQAIIAIIMPLAFSTIPNAGIGLFISLMCMNYIAMQVCPTHICLSIVCEDFGTSMESLVRKTMPVMIAFMIISSIYSYVLAMIFGG